jgi:hypothetical protein
MYKGTNRNPITVIIFSIISCGVYGLYWIYMMLKDINGMLNREEFSTGFIIATMFVPFWYLYTYHKINDFMKEECPRRGIAWGENNFLIWIIGAFTGGWGMLVAMFQIQTALNSVWESDV